MKIPFFSYNKRSLSYCVTTSQLAIGCSKLTSKILEQAVNLFKVNNKDRRTTSLTNSGVFIVNFEHISYLVLEFLLSSLNSYIPAELSGTTNLFKFNQIERFFKTIIKTDDMVTIKICVLFNQPTQYLNNGRKIL